MRFTLKDYQESARIAALDNLSKAVQYSTASELKSGFAVVAPTGSGKTVIAASIIESLLLGSYDYQPDPNAVIIWFSDDPELNLQSKHRIEEASPTLRGHLKDINKDTLTTSELPAGSVYFINTQKFSKSSTLVKGRGDKQETITSSFLEEFTPDTQHLNIWSVLKNTIENEDNNVYFIVDEAHRGASKASRDVDTVLRRIIGGWDDPNSGATIPPMPIVMGVSATPARFRAMLVEMGGERIPLKDVEVRPADVQASGLLKDVLMLSFPDEKGDYSSQFLRVGVRSLLQYEEKWKNYCESQGLELMKPLMVVQVPNNCTPELLGSYISYVKDEWSGLEESSFANVFGEHTDIVTPHGVVPYVPPERIQDRDWVRVVFAKDAISTGWDCPRAEVLVSFRGAQDETRITQILGRMVRTPLARRIEGDDFLNSTTCILPLFREDTATKVAQRLSRDDGPYHEDDGTGGGLGRKVLVKPTVFSIAEKYDEVVDAAEALPTYSLPTTRPRPITRLINLSSAVARDNIRPHQVETTRKEMVSFMDGLVAMHREEINAMIEDIRVVDASVVSYNIMSEGESTKEFMAMDADATTIEGSYKLSHKVLGSELAGAYVNHLVERAESEGEEDFEDVALESKLLVAAMSMVDVVVDEMKKKADEMSAYISGKAKRDIGYLPEERRAHYKGLSDLAYSPVETTFTLPRTILENKKGDAYSGHIIADENGEAFFNLNSLEQLVLESEMSNDRFLCWYRNTHGGKDGTSPLLVPYVSGGANRAMYPDFLFFSRGIDGSVVASIVDPHSHHLEDSLDKLKGLARFAELHGEAFYRIESVFEEGTGVNRNVLSINLLDQKSREFVLGAESIKQVQQCEFVSQYDG